MKRFNTSAKVSSGVLTTVLALAIPAHAIAARHTPQSKTNHSQVQTVIEEWHWRDMNF